MFLEAGLSGAEERLTRLEARRFVSLTLPVELRLRCEVFLLQQVVLLLERFDLLFLALFLGQESLELGGHLLDGHRVVVHLHLIVDCFVV